MIDFFYKTYDYSFNVKNRIFYALKLDKILRLVIRFLSTYLSFYVLKPTKIGDEKASNFVVNITSFPGRIKFVHVTIISLMRQDVQPKQIILWLSRDQFPISTNLPKKLSELQEYGLVIQFVENDLRSYKKYVHFIQVYGHEQFIIFDDDIIYPSWIIKDLVLTHKKYPDSVICNRCVEIKSDIPYSLWPVVKSKEVKQSVSLLPTGCGGVLYPKNSLHNLSTDQGLFLQLCPDGDDIWLYSCTMYNQKDIVYTGGFTYFIDMIIPRNKTLCSINVVSGNDLKVRNVKKYFKESLNFDVFN